MKDLMKQISKNFMTGMLAILPIAVAIFVIGFIYGLIKDASSAVIDSHNTGTIVILIIVTIGIIILVGREIGKNNKLSLITLGELWLSKFPLVGKVVGIIKQFMDMVQGKGKFEDLGVAMVPFGGSSVYALITNEHRNENDEKIFTVFIVQGTFPPVGLVCFYNESEVEIVEEMTPADVFQLQVTLGVKTEK